MSNPKYTRIEISGEGDIELLDYALQGMGVGKIERNWRLMNIERWEHVQFSLTRKGKRTVWQPFRAEFARDAAGNFVVTTANMSFYAQEVIKQAGFKVGNVTLGDFPDNGRGTSTKISYSCTLNGRSLSITIDTSK